MVNSGYMYCTQLRLRLGFGLGFWFGLRSAVVFVANSSRPTAAHTASRVYSNVLKFLSAMLLYYELEFLQAAPSVEQTQKQSEHL